MAKNTEYCIGCGEELLIFDQDPNGRVNATCKRCIAHENHDFDVEPNAVFNRMGERIELEPSLKRMVLVTGQVDPDLLLVSERELLALANTLDAQRYGSAALVLRAIVSKARATATFKQQQV